MPDASQFTLGLFDSTAIGWTIATPKADPETEPAEPAADESNPHSTPVRAAAPPRHNLYLDLDRALARGWPARARDNIAAIRLSKEIEAAGRAPTAEEQARTAAVHRLRRDRTGAELLPAAGRHGVPPMAGTRPAATCRRRDAARIRRPAARHAIRALHARADRPRPLARRTASRLLRRARARARHGHRPVLRTAAGSPARRHPGSPAWNTTRSPRASPAWCIPRRGVRCEDFTRSKLAGGFDLAIGNPPFADRIVRADPTTASLGLRLHDYFIARSIARLRPGGIALFVTSTGTMDKASTDRPRAHRRPGRPDRRGAPARGQHARDRRHRRRDRRARVPAPRRGRGTDRTRLDRPGGHRTAAATGDATTEERRATTASPEALAGPAPRQVRRGVARSTSTSPPIPRWCSAHTRQTRHLRPGPTYTCRARPDDAALPETADHGPEPTAGRHLRAVGRVPRR